jgi:rare lipoprotein A
VPRPELMSPHGGHAVNAMNTMMAIVGCVGVLLISSPGEGRGGASQAGQVGWASWYGQAHEGRKTASGERFARSQLTAAHRSLPLGTKVRVTNLRTGQQVLVIINDRGPHGGGKRRIIDLSEAAAKRVGLLAQGTARVQVVVVEHAS